MVQVNSQLVRLLSFEPLQYLRPFFSSIFSFAVVGLNLPLLYLFFCFSLPSVSFLKGHKASSTLNFRFFLKSVYYFIRRKRSPFKIYQTLVLFLQMLMSAKMEVLRRRGFVALEKWKNDGREKQKKRYNKGIFKPTTAEQNIDE